MKRAWPQNISKLKTSEAFGLCNAFSRTVQALTNEAHSATELEEGTSYLPDHVIATCIPYRYFRENEFSKCSKWSSASIVRVGQKQSSHWFETDRRLRLLFATRFGECTKSPRSRCRRQRAWIRTDGKAGAGFRVLSTVTEFQVNQPVT